MSRRRRRERDAPLPRRPGRLVIGLTLALLVLLIANLVAFYALHPPPIVTIAVLVVLAGALALIRRVAYRP